MRREDGWKNCHTSCGHIGLHHVGQQERPLFSMTYGAEAVIPLETSFPMLRMSTFTSSNSDELLRRSLDLIEERREKVMIRLAYYHQKLKQRYDANVKLRPLASGDLVLRKVLGILDLGKAGAQLGRTISHHFSSRNMYILFRRLR